jgi:SagB-type dehydrogenase family enzyme
LSENYQVLLEEVFDMDDATMRREFMKSGFSKGPILSDRRRGLPQPSLEKPHNPDFHLIDLPEANSNVVKNPEILSCIASRTSRRQFTGEGVSIPELSFLLWATQGTKKVLPGATFRSVPSAGARHPYETYLVVRNVEGLTPGLYRYLALSHKLEAINVPADLSDEAVKATGNQTWVRPAAVFLIWAVEPYRCEWQYGKEAAKFMLLDAGHICQNLYLAAEALGCGTCAIGAYDQEAMDRLIGVDGEDEYVVYCAPLGRV